MAELTTEHGFAAVRVTELIARAGVAKPRFYELYESKVGCFLALIDQVFAETTAAIAEAIEPGADVRARIAQGMDALVDQALDAPTRARILFVDGPSAGREAIDRIAEGRALLARFYVALREEVRESDPSLPPMEHLRSVVIVGAISEVIATGLRDPEGVDRAELKAGLISAVELLAVGPTG